MKKRGAGRKESGSKFQKVICVVGYAIVPLFFVLLYMLMTETYEDIVQANHDATSSVPMIIDRIYHYLPRIGEFYQHIAVHFMTEQVSFGPDMLFRLLTATIASGVIYFSTFFVLGRRPKLEYKDVIIYLGVMSLVVVSAFSEAFTYRFSYANNYALASLILVVFLLIFRVGVNNKTWWKMLCALVLGFAFGISTEIAPVAFLILIGVWTLVKMIKKEITVADLRNKYSIQAIAVVGLVLGLAFFYIGGGIGNRTDSGYVAIYDYVSPMGILRDPLMTIYRLMRHVWYNLRYIFFAIPLMGCYVFVEATLFAKEQKKYLSWQIAFLSFCVLFVGATSLIMVHDDLYPRFMVPMFIVVVLATLLFVRHILEYSKVEDRVLKIPVMILVSMGVVMLMDVAFAFGRYNRAMAPLLERINYAPGSNTITVEYMEENYTMSPSPVFRLKQLPPFDWGPEANYMKFGL